MLERILEEEVACAKAFNREDRGPWWKSRLVGGTWHQVRLETSNKTSRSSRALKAKV